MTNEEMKQSITAFGPRGLRLLGFKPIDQLDLDLSLRHASFIYPQDESINAFRALLVRCQVFNLKK
jgi:Ku70/Ku80 beta-barrel domain